MPSERKIMSLHIDFCIARGPKWSALRTPSQFAAGCGSRLKVTVTGTDSADMVKALEELIARKFDEE